MDAHGPVRLGWVGAPTMKLWLAVTAAIVLAGAPVAYAQTQGQSDDYVCNHGDQADARTQEACGRLRGPAANTGVEPDAAPRHVTNHHRDEPVLKAPEPDAVQPVDRRCRNPNTGLFEACPTSSGSEIDSDYGRQLH